MFLHVDLIPKYMALQPRRPDTLQPRRQSLKSNKNSKSLRSTNDKRKQLQRTVYIYRNI
jgi:hypothetical protein